MKTLFKLPLFCFTLLSLLAAFKSQASLPTLTQLRRQEPKLSELMDAHFQQERLDYSDFSKLKRRMRKAAYLPTLYVGFDQQVRNTNSLSITDNISVSSGTVTVGPEDNDVDFNSLAGSTFRVRAVWALDETIFSRYDLPLAGAERDRQRQRQNVRKDIATIFEARAQAFVQFSILQKSSPEKAQLYLAKFLTLTDRLDDLSGNQFTKTFWRPQ